MTRSDDLRARMAGKAKSSSEASQLRHAMRPAAPSNPGDVAVEIETVDGTVKMRFSGPADEVALATAELVRHLRDGNPSIELVEAPLDES